MKNQLVKMVKTLAPNEIPNGTTGEVLPMLRGHPGMIQAGLNAVKFENALAYVYAHEVEVINYG